VLSTSNATYGTCGLNSAGTGSGSDLAIVLVPAGSETSVSVQAALTLSSAGTATLSCTGALETTTFGRTHLDAIAVATLTGGL
jgi:hypothetical protein